MKMEIDRCTLESVARLIGDIFSVVTINIFMHIFYKKERSRLLLIATYILDFFSIRILMSTMNKPILILGLNLLFVFIITYNYKSRFRTRMIVTVYLNAMMMMVETVTVNLTTLAGLNLKNSSDSAVISLLSCIISFFIVLVFRNISMLQMRAELPAGLCTVVSLIPAGSTIVIFFMVVTKSCTFLFAIIITVFFFLLNLIVFSLYYDLVDKFNQTLKIKGIEQQNNYYEKQLHIMLEAQNKIRRYRHDNKTKLMILQTMLINHEDERALEYLEEMGGDFKAKDEIVSTGNVAIDAVINYKLQNVAELKMKTEISISIPEKLRIDAMDIAVLIGNLLDNAILATEKVDGERKIGLHIDYDRNVLHIHIANPYSGGVKFFNGKYLTTKKDRENHGIGLASIGKIVEKYNGVMEIEHENHRFVVEIILYVKSDEEDI